MSSKARFERRFETTFERQRLRRTYRYTIPFGSGGGGGYRSEETTDRRSYHRDDDDDVRVFAFLIFEIPQTYYVKGVD